MKKTRCFLLTLLLSAIVLTISGTTARADTIIGFDPTGNGANYIYADVWTNFTDSGLSIGFIPGKIIPAVDPVYTTTFKYQARIAGMQALGFPVTPAGLNSDYELTLELMTPETVMTQGTFVDSFGRTHEVASYLSQDATGTVKLYFDNFSNGGIPANPNIVSGYGDDDGIGPILTAHVVDMSASFDGVISSPTPGDPEVGKGTGSFQIRFMVDSVNPNYIDAEVGEIVGVQASGDTKLPPTFTPSVIWDGTSTVSPNILIKVDASETFLTAPKTAGSCRMTGGSETLITDYIYGPTYVWNIGSYATEEGKVWVTTGGQIGAPMASPSGPSFGEWEHQQHCGNGKKCPAGTFGFNFKAGTASDKGTIINKVECGDPGWCTQARCAPFKQIFWDGVGVIKNIAGTFLPLNACSNIGEGSFHYFQAHVGDFGEPGSSVVRKKTPPTCDTPCPWTSGGVDINNIEFLSPVSTAPDPFGLKGGQICPCGCGDWYEIEIHCTTDPGSSIIYRFNQFIDTGNFQLHPPVGQHCD